MLVTLVLLDLALMALIPLRRPGLDLPRRHSWLPALPSLASAALLAADRIAPSSRWWPAGSVLDVAAAGVATLSLALLLATRAARGRGGGWTSAAPSGPDAVVRHPAHAARGLALLAAALALPQALTAAALACGLAALDASARAEERALLASPLAEDWRRHSARTGRFLPRLRDD